VIFVFRVAKIFASKDCLPAGVSKEDTRNTRLQQLLLLITYLTILTFTGASSAASPTHLRRVHGPRSDGKNDAIRGAGVISFDAASR
jgi:hypothetical protein